MSELMAGSARPSSLKNPNDGPSSIGTVKKKRLSSKTPGETRRARFMPSHSSTADHLISRLYQPSSTAEKGVFGELFQFYPFKQWRMSRLPCKCSLQVGV